MVIIAGDKNPQEDFYTHSLPNKTSAKGVVHFFQQDG